ncbi:hypothetical protein B0H13DRAFT_1856160 [Mycena leptocephala]|nr:hypothetical protein B0H13DRAFT_1856160 [Mycena leptocephala]
MCGQNTRLRQHGPNKRLETVCDDLQNEWMDAGFDTEGEESEEYGGVGGGSGERVVTADGSVTRTYKEPRDAALGPTVVPRLGSLELAVWEKKGISKNEQRREICNISNREGERRFSWTDFTNSSRAEVLNEPRWVHPMAIGDPEDGAGRTRNTGLSERANSTELGAISALGNDLGEQEKEGSIRNMWKSAVAVVVVGDYERVVGGRKWRENEAFGGGAYGTRRQLRWLRCSAWVVEDRVSGTSGVVGGRERSHSGEKRNIQEGEAKRRRRHFMQRSLGLRKNNGCQEENGQKEMARLTRTKKTRRRMRGQQGSHDRKGLWEMVSRDVWGRGDNELRPYSGQETRGQRGHGGGKQEKKGGNDVHKPSLEWAKHGLCLWRLICVGINGG